MRYSGEFIEGLIISPFIYFNLFLNIQNEKGHHP